MASAWVFRDAPVSAHGLCALKKQRRGSGRETAQQTRPARRIAAPDARSAGVPACQVPSRSSRKRNQDKERGARGEAQTRPEAGGPQATRKKGENEREAREEPGGQVSSNISTTPSTTSADTWTAVERYDPRAPPSPPACPGFERRSSPRSRATPCLQCHTTPRNAMHNAMQCHAMPCHATPCNTMQCHDVPQGARVCHDMPQYAMICHESRTVPLTVEGPGHAQAIRSATAKLHARNTIDTVRTTNTYALGICRSNTRV